MGDDHDSVFLERRFFGRIKKIPRSLHDFSVTHMTQALVKYKMTRFRLVRNSHLV